MGMFEHTSFHAGPAKAILEEIEKDTNDWFGPKGNPGEEEMNVGDFDYGKVKYLNRNLNYFYYENMVHHALKDDYEYNKNFQYAIDFLIKRYILIRKTRERECDGWQIRSRFIFPYPEFIQSL